MEIFIFRKVPWFLINTDYNEDTGCPELGRALKNY